MEKSRQAPDFRLLFFTETGTDSLRRETAAHTPPPHCHPGRISLDVIWSEVSDAEKKVFYLSGPPVMLTTLGDEIAEAWYRRWSNSHGRLGMTFAPPAI